MNKKKADEMREGLMLCMLLTSCIDGTSRADEIREMAIIASEEPEFLDKDAQSFDQILEHAQHNLHKGPDALMNTIVRLLPTQEMRRRGLELAARIVVSDGIVRPAHVRLLEELAGRLELPEEVLGDLVMASQRRLVRFMMVYLIYLTAMADGDLAPEEFEEMIPYALNLPVFRGITTKQFRHLVHSARNHLDSMGQEWGVEYICGTLLKAAELLNDSTIPEQALKLVAHGLLADGKISESEKEFFLKLSTYFKVNHGCGERVIEDTIRESQETVKKP